MPRKTKRQQQVNQIPRKKGHYVSQDQVIMEETTTEVIETVEEGEKWWENEIIEEWIEDEVIKEWSEDETIKLSRDEAVENWTEEDLKEFDVVGNRLITEALLWHEDATRSIRAVYTGNSRTTMWRKEKEKKKLKEDAKGMRTLDTFFRSRSSPFPKITQNPSFSVDNLHIRLEEINQQCLISKSAKKNEKLFTYDYLRCLSIRRFIQLLLDGQGKMNASDNIAQTMWNKGDYMVRCIRKWGTHFIQTGELL